MTRRRLALALLIACAVVATLLRTELIREVQLALALLGRGDRTAIEVALAVFVLVPLSSALTWCCALGSGLPIAGACARYGVGSLVNAFVPARAGDAVRLFLFSRLLHGTSKRTVAIRFGALELMRIAVFGALGVALVEPLAGAALGVIAGAFCLWRGRARVGVAVALAAAVRVGAFAVALGALEVSSPLDAALRLVPALELAAIAPLTPGNAAFASFASAVALRASGVPVASGLALGVALHLLETAGAVCFGALSLAFLGAHRFVRVAQFHPASRYATAQPDKHAGPTLASG